MTPRTRDGVSMACSGYVGVERGLAEFRCGRPVVIAADRCVAAMPIDGCDDERLELFRRMFDVKLLELVVSARRACGLGVQSDAAVALALNAGGAARDFLELAAGTSFRRDFDVCRASAAMLAAVDLAKLAGRLPAVLVGSVGPAARQNAFVEFAAGAVAEFRQHLADSLEIAASTVIPFNGVDAAQFVVFRDAIGGESVAVIIGRPDPSQPVPVRLHSACLTGDVFGSRRCDCGDQLRLAISRMKQAGGLILYLPQEGRGLGLLNKIRAYRLQDAGLDTVEANMVLGFENDERDYRIAARILQLLGCSRVLLLTNNPDKLVGLSNNGIEVCGRLPLQAPVTASNRRYLETMATRAGHRFDCAWQ